MLGPEDHLDLATIDRAVEAARSAKLVGPVILPVELDGKRFYPVLCRHLTAEEIAAAEAKGVEFFDPAELEDRLGFKPHYLDLGQGQP